jgi:hypothetical protein
LHLLFRETHFLGAAHPADDAKWKKAIDALPSKGPEEAEPAELEKWHFVEGSTLAASSGGGGK